MKLHVFVLATWRTHYYIDIIQIHKLILSALIYLNLSKQWVPHDVFPKKRKK